MEEEPLTGLHWRGDRGVRWEAPREAAGDTRELVPGTAWPAPAEEAAERPGGSGTGSSGTPARPSPAATAGPGPPGPRGPRGGRRGPSRPPPAPAPRPRAPHHPPHRPPPPSPARHAPPLPPGGEVLPLKGGATGVAAEDADWPAGRAGRDGRGGPGGAPVPGWGRGPGRGGVPVGAGRARGSAMALWALLPLLALLAGAATSPGAAPAEPPLPGQPPDALFAAGAEAYTRGDWPAVVLHMERALRARAAVRSRLVRCRLRCANATAGPAEGTEPQPEPALRDLLFFRGLLRRAACLRGCGPAEPSRYRLGEELEREFSKRSPYNYLQVAYFKVRDRRWDRDRGWVGPGAAVPATAPGRERGCPGAAGTGTGGVTGAMPGATEGTERTGRGRSWAGVLGGLRLSGPVCGVSHGGPGPCPSLPAPRPVPRRSSPEPPPSPPHPAGGTPWCPGNRVPPHLWGSVPGGRPSHPHPPSRQMNRPAQAAAAAHTFFVANPAHQEMRQNLEYYQAMAGVRQDDFTDLEAKPHLVRPPCCGQPLPKPLGRSQRGCWLSKRVRCHLGAGGLSPAHGDTVPRVLRHLELSPPSNFSPLCRASSGWVSGFTRRSSRLLPSCTWRRRWGSILWRTPSAARSARDPTTTRATTTWSTTRTFSRPSRVGAVGRSWGAMVPKHLKGGGSQREQTP